MGKVRRARKKYHLAAPGGSAAKGDDVRSETSSVSGRTAPASVCGRTATASVSGRSSLHKNFDQRSVISSRSGAFPERKMKKKDKRKLRHEALLQKIGAIQAATAEKERLYREQAETCFAGNVPGGDELLLNALPSLEYLIKSHGTQRTPSKDSYRPQNRSTSLKAKHKNMLSDIGMFNRVLKHPAFKANPQGSISAHIRNTLEAKNDEDVVS